MNKWEWGATILFLMMFGVLFFYIIPGIAEGAEEQRQTQYEKDFETISIHCSNGCLNYNRLSEEEYDVKKLNDCRNLCDSYTSMFLHNSSS